MSEILGVLFAVFFGIMAIPKFAQYQQNSNDNTRAATTAEQQKLIITAGTAYIQQNSVALQGSATSSVPTTLTVAMLQTAGLPASFNATNPYGQTWQVEVLQPTPGNLQALAMSTGGDTLPDKQVTKIATLVGATGGFIPQNDSSLYPGAAANAYGAFAGWGPIPTANYTSVTGGHPAALLTFNNGALVSNYLYRNLVAGQPQLNTMNTPLQFGTATVQTVDGACLAADLGKLARDTSGKVLMCNGSNWKTQGSAYWQDPAATFAALPVCNAAALNQTRVAQTPSVGTGPRAYTCDGAIWQPLGINDSGNITISGTATVGAACSPNGKVAQDGTGLLLSCQSGVWAKLFNPAAFVTATANSATCAGGCGVAVSVPCPGSTQIITGGCTLFGGGPANTTIFSSYQSGNNWYCALWNASAAFNGVQARATCQ